MLRKTTGGVLVVTQSYLSLGKQSNIPLNVVLKNIRLRKGISTRQLAEKCGFSSAYFSKIESGSTVPSSKFLAKIVDVLECSPEEILFIIGILAKVDDES